MNSREKGTEYETLACDYMEAFGFRVTERNFRCRQGEIDIVGRHEGYLVFVEVKYRSTNAKGTPEEAVNRTKQLRICRSADYYRLLHGYSEEQPVRYDVIAISGAGQDPQIHWYRNAFSHVYRR